MGVTAMVLSGMTLSGMILFGGLAQAQAPSERFTSPQGFSLSVPDGWQVMTKEQSQPVADYLRARTKFNPDRMAAMIYSPADPRVNVNVIVLMGAVPLDDDATKGYAAMLQDQAAQAGVTVAGLTVNRHNYAQHGSLLADYDMDFSNSNGPNKELGRVHQWQAVFSGPSNTYVVTCTAGASAFPVVAPVFERLLNSLDYSRGNGPVGPEVQPQLTPVLAPAPAPALASSQPNAQGSVPATANMMRASEGGSRSKPIRMYTPKDADVYCAGFITDKPPISGLFVITGAEGGLQETFTERDTVYLSRGAGYIVRPGGDYMLLRKIQDPNNKLELFLGQNKLLKSMGQVYSEVGRLRIDIVHEFVATARITESCGEIQPGDIAIPLNLKPTPPAPTGVYDRFAPSSGKNEGVIATGKEFEATLAAGKTVYLNIGAEQGVEVGQLYRIFRTFATASNDPNRAYLDQTPTELFGMRQNYKLSKEQRAILPRDILGELVILSVQGKTATALITMSADEIFPGDQVEMK